MWLQTKVNIVGTVIALRDLKAGGRALIFSQTDLGPMFIRSRERFIKNEEK